MRFQIVQLMSYDYGYAAATGPNTIVYDSDVITGGSPRERVNSWLSKSPQGDGWYCFVVGTSKLDYLWTFRVEDNQISNDLSAPSNTNARLTTWPPK